ncbi:DUF1571 domain-containing protein [Rhodopirellula sallentina]|uniref:Protein containing DUF1571 n=1 Tax=Rhodopirellula sallentina SM41 TaxID=1263870 RepID=M5U9V8_9BACT|nr:DUF1571 domain-containing protein [Rhodopirellula sallentina]EMI52788.1 protein containing DUF1571 [Rhodopirellula sallentina SM41]
MSDQTQLDNTPNVWRRLIVIPAIASMLVGILASGDSHDREPVSAVVTAPQPMSAEEIAAAQETDSNEVGKTVEVSMDEMLDLAEDALEATVANVDDYTARMIKQEQDRSGVLQPASECFMKVATRHPGGKPGSPLKVYMRFDSPDDVRGREVIWVENENDGKLLVREAGAIGAMMTVPLPPDGFLAMRGQRYPITEIGLTRLLEKLITRGSVDREDPSVRVFKTEGHPYDGRSLTHLRIQRSKPSGREGDFSLAELVLDRERNLVVSFRSFDWPDEETGERTLIESYEYHDLQLNVGLTDHDFDPANPEYTFVESKASR